MSKACDSQESSGLSAALMPPWAAFECDRTGWTLEMIPTDAPARAALEGGALAGEAGSYDEDVVLGQGGADSMQTCGVSRLGASTPCCSARRTWSIVTTPRSRPSGSTAISAPIRRSGSLPSSASSGSSVRTRQVASSGRMISLTVKTRLALARGSAPRARGRPGR